MLKILCYNIKGGYDLRRTRNIARINALMNKYDIDVGVFQEFETRASRGATLKDIDTVAGPERLYQLQGLAMVENEGWYGNLIVSRYPILNGVVHDLETSPSLEPRNAIDATIKTPYGNVRLIGTHLSLSPWERWSEVRNLVRLLKTVDVTEKGPLILMGDINEWRPTSKLLRFLNDHFTPIPLARSFPSFLPIFKLDRVWHENIDSKRISARILKYAETGNLSDHCPILIEVGL
jgi:endonuclease/exonuclease/phosphatase family metal-dependent hydrolase